MHINWAALGVVTVVAISTTLVFTLLLAGGIRFLSVAVLRGNRGESGTAASTAGWGLLAAAGLLVVYGLYLIVPLFH